MKTDDIAPVSHCIPPRVSDSPAFLAAYTAILMGSHVPYSAEEDWPTFFMHQAIPSAHPGHYLETRHVEYPHPGVPYGATPQWRRNADRSRISLEEQAIAIYGRAPDRLVGRVLIASQISSLEDHGQPPAHLVAFTFVVDNRVAAHALISVFPPQSATTQVSLTLKLADIMRKFTAIGFVTGSNTSTLALASPSPAASLPSASDASVAGRRLPSPTHDHPAQEDVFTPGRFFHPNLPWLVVTHPRGSGLYAGPWPRVRPYHAPRRVLLPNTIIQVQRFLKPHDSGTI